jgi:hypothetical protein
MNLTTKKTIKVTIYSAAILLGLLYSLAMILATLLGLALEAAEKGIEAVEAIETEGSIEAIEAEDTEDAVDAVDAVEAIEAEDAPLEEVPTDVLLAWMEDEGIPTTDSKGRRVSRPALESRYKKAIGHE